CFTLAKLTPTIQHMTFWRTDPRSTLVAYVGRLKSKDEMKTDPDNAKKCRQVIDPNKWLQFATEDPRERWRPFGHLKSIGDHITIFETKALEEEQVAWVLAKEEKMVSLPSPIWYCTVLVGSIPDKVSYVQTLSQVSPVLETSLVGRKKTSNLYHFPDGNL
ncbi:hypothetical protein BaRGS_00038093, partial [Batillaria attramentaria]